MRKSRGIPNNWMPNENKFRKECAEFKIRELAKKYNVCIDTICDWKKEFDISHGRLKPKKIKWVVESTGCWRCTSHKANTSTGYVYIRKDKLVSKILYERKFGKIKGNGKCMLHKCDNRWCINPDHFFLGSKADNCRDRTIKGRQASGERIAQHKLKEAEVISIYEARNHGSCSKLAKVCQLPRIKMRGL